MHGVAYITVLQIIFNVHAYTAAKCLFLSFTLWRHLADVRY